MNIERQVQQRWMFGPRSGEGEISGLPPGRSSGGAPVAGGPAAAAGVEQAGVERVLTAVAGVLAAGQRGVAVVEGGQAGNGLAGDAQLSLHRRLPDPVLLERLHVAGVDQGVGVLLRGLEPPGAVEALPQLVGEAGGPPVGGAIL